MVLRMLLTKICIRDKNCVGNYFILLWQLLLFLYLLYPTLFLVSSVNGRCLAIVGVKQSIFFNE